MAGVDLRQLRSLVAVVDEGTFTDGALALGVTQASVSRAVAALEAALGARLLQRTSRGAGVTVTGARVVAHARRVLAEVDALHGAVREVGGEVRMGYAWAALGRHTTPLQRRWSELHPVSALVLVQCTSPTAGLLEGAADVAVTRRPLDDSRFDTALVGVEARMAAVASDDPLARRRTLRLADFAGRTVGVDDRTGTTTPDLWPEGAAPASTRRVSTVDEWLTLIAAGQAVGLTAEATARQHLRPGVAFRRVTDAPPVPVRLVWWRDDPPPHVPELVRLVSELYGRPPARGGAG
ncbi:LysR family transcriptional regulator [Aquipuribacter nitratireducens]|uniref:LysR family transcriptional regulator n=1 Tax=Aquipuribacter nitratireducens TaxID=650104 RepID=A0ABW0GN68_9MICO